MPVRHRQYLIVAALLGMIACGGDSTGPSSSYESIAGSYAGSMAGLAQGVAMSADFTLTLTQSSGSLSGSYSLSGTLNDGVDIVAVQGTGTVAGSIASGDNPSVNLIAKTAACPSYSAQFSGAYDSANQRLTITGPVEFFGSGTCSVVLSYPTTIILNR
jgi:hypothetical protein